MDLTDFARSIGLVPLLLEAELTHVEAKCALYV
jgi:hypothetical protein